MSLQKRIENLEHRQAGPTRNFIAQQDLDNENVFHVSENGHAIHGELVSGMTTDELKQFEVDNPNVQIWKLVFVNMLDN